MDLEVIGFYSSQIFKKLFDDGLDIQKQRIRELREYAKEKREALAQRQQNEIESLENLYPLNYDLSSNQNI